MGRLTQEKLNSFKAAVGDWVRLPVSDLFLLVGEIERLKALVGENDEKVSCPACRVQIVELRRAGRVIMAGDVQVLSYVCPHCGKKIHWGVRV